MNLSAKPLILNIIQCKGAAQRERRSDSAGVSFFMEEGILDVFTKHSIWAYMEWRKDLLLFMAAVSLILHFIWGEVTVWASLERLDIHISTEYAIVDYRMLFIMESDVIISWSCAGRCDKISFSYCHGRSTKPRHCLSRSIKPKMHKCIGWLSTLNSSIGGE